MISDDQLIGLTVHVLEPTQILRTTSPFASATLLKRGDVLELTEEDIEANKNRHGECTFACIDDPDLQILRWGREVFGIGAWPTELPLYRTEEEDPRSWSSTKIISRSKEIASYAGGDGFRPGVRPSLRSEW